MDVSTYEPRHWEGDWQVRFNLPEDLKVHRSSEKKEPFEPMRDLGWEFRFPKLPEGYEPDHAADFEVKLIDRTPTDEEIQQQMVHQWMREWIDYSNGVQKELDIEETPIEEVMEADDFSAYVDDASTGQTGKMYSSGIKRNGKVDIGFKFPDGRAQILRDCSPTLSDSDSVNNSLTDVINYDSSTDPEFSMKFHYDAYTEN